MMKRYGFILAVLLAFAGAAHADSMTGGGVSPSNPNTWVVQYDGTCVTPRVGTGASATFTPTCPFNYIVIDTAGQTILLPPTPPPFSVATYTLDITYSGNVAPQFVTGTQWQNKTPPVVCSTTVTAGCISATNGAHDRIVGQIDATLGLVYGAPISNYGAPSGGGGAFVQAKIGPLCAAGTSCSVTFTSPIVVGDMVVCGLAYPGTAALAAGGISDGTNSFTVVDSISNGTSITGHTAVLLNEVTAGKTVITSTLTASRNNSQLLCEEYQPTALRTVDNHSPGSQSSPSGTDSVTSGAVTLLASDLVWGFTANLSGGLTISAGTGFTLGLTDPGSSGAFNVTSERKTSTAGSQAATFTPSANSTFFVTGLVAIK